jgi:hypothetical protein
MAQNGYQYIVFDEGMSKQKGKEHIVEGYELLYGGRANRPRPEKPTMPTPGPTEMPLLGAAAAKASSSYPTKSDHPVGKKVK